MPTLTVNAPNAATALRVVEHELNRRKMGTYTATILGRSREQRADDAVALAVTNGRTENQTFDVRTECRGSRTLGARFGATNNADGTYTGGQIVCPKCGRKFDYPATDGRTIAGVPNH